MAANAFACRAGHWHPLHPPLLGLEDIVTVGTKLAVTPETVSGDAGAYVPIPTLPPETVTGELPTVEVPVKTGTVLVVPLPITVCAAAPADASAKLKPSHIRADLLIVPNPSVRLIGVFSGSRLALNWTAFVTLLAECAKRHATALPTPEMVSCVVLERCLSPSGDSLSIEVANIQLQIPSSAIRLHAPIRYPYAENDIILNPLPLRRQIQPTLHALCPGVPSTCNCFYF